MPKSDPFKVIILGDSGVGKSTIVASHCGERFNPCYVQTRERVIQVTQVTVNGRRVKLQIWDTPGTDQCRTMTAAYVSQDVKGVIVVFDVSNDETFLNVPHWMKTVKEYSGDDALSVVFVGNKVDKSRKVLQESGVQLASQYNAESYIDASAKLNKNISQVFTSIASAIVNKQERPRSPTPAMDDDDYQDESRTGFKCILV